MCGRYYVDDELEDQIKRVLNASGGPEPMSVPGMADGPRDVLPSEQAPVILHSGGTLKCAGMLWGFPNPRGKGLLINARAETAKEKPTFRDSIRRRRCVIPASGFYEWDRDRNRVTFFRDDRKILWFAGFYDLFDDRDRFIILTTGANASMLPVHDRMPCLLEEEMIGSWILCDQAADECLLREMPALHRFQEFEQQSLFG